MITIIANIPCKNAPPRYRKFRQNEIDGQWQLEFHGAWEFINQFEVMAICRMSQNWEQIRERHFS